MTTPRRNVLRMIAAAPFIAGGVKVAEQLGPKERVDALSAQLVAAMNELDSTRVYRCKVSAEHGFALICGDNKA